MSTAQGIKVFKIYQKEIYYKERLSCNEKTKKKESRLVFALDILSSCCYMLAQEVAITFCILALSIQDVFFSKYSVC